MTDEEFQDRVARRVEFDARKAYEIGIGFIDRAPTDLYGEIEMRWSWDDLPEQARENRRPPVTMTWRQLQLDRQNAVETIDRWLDQGWAVCAWDAPGGLLLRAVKPIEEDQ